MYSIKINKNLRAAVDGTPSQIRLSYLWPLQRYLGAKVKQNVAQYPLHHVTYAPVNFCFVWFYPLHPINTLSVKQGRVFLGWTSTKLGWMCLAQGPQRRDAGEARTRSHSVSSQALYHWATALPPVNFEVATCTSNCLGEYAFTRNYILWPWPWGHTNCYPVQSLSCDRCTCKVWSSYLQHAFTRKYIIWPWPSRSHKMLPSTLHIMWPMHLWSLLLLLPTVWDDMHLQENTLYGKILPMQYPLHHVTYAPAKFEVASSNALDGDVFTRKYKIWPLTLRSNETSPSTVPSTSCDLCICKV